MVTTIKTSEAVLSNHSHTQSFHLVVEASKREFEKAFDKMKLFLLVWGFVGLALADVKKEGKYVKEEKHYVKEEKHGAFYNQPYSYHGRYQDKCDKDGFYYKDDASFVVCSNNNAYMQPCAPGSRNSPFEKFNYGATYHYRDFCDINLVDHGYGVNHYGYGNKVPHYEEPKYEAYGKQHQYHGKYNGQCDKDGFYYKNDDSFVICSNNNAYVQPCAPGTRNSGYNSYHLGSAYYYRDFCEVNLVDHGYGVQHGYKGYEQPKGYGGYGKGYEQGKPQYGEYHGYERREYGGYENKGRRGGYGFGAGYGRPSFHRRGLY